MFLFFPFKKFSLFCVSLYKKLLEPTFSACLTVLNNICDVSGCSVIIDFISTIDGFWKGLGWYVIISVCFPNFLYSFIINDL